MQAVFWSVLKTQMVNSTKLMKVFCESDLCPGKGWVGENLCSEFGDCILAPLRETRTAANRAAVDCKGTTIKAVFASNLQGWSLTDKFMSIESSFFTSMMGEAGSAIVQQRVRSYFSTQDRHRPKLATVSQQMDALLQSKVFQFCGQGLQNESTQFAKVTSGMLLGTAPVCKANATEVGPPPSTFCVFVSVGIWQGGLT